MGKVGEANLDLHPYVGGILWGPHDSVTDSFSPAVLFGATIEGAHQFSSGLTGTLGVGAHASFTLLPASDSPQIIQKTRTAYGSLGLRIRLFEWQLYPTNPHSIFNIEAIIRIYGGGSSVERASPDPHAHPTFGGMVGFTLRNDENVWSGMVGLGMLQWFSDTNEVMGMFISQFSFSLSNLFR